jgi:integrase/recombinase XerD
MKLSISLDIIRQEKQYYYLLKHPYDQKIFFRIREIDSSRWDRTMSGWLIPASGKPIESIMAWLEGYGEIHAEAAYKKIAEIKAERRLQPHLDRFAEYLGRLRYSMNTTKTYVEAIRHFLKYFAEKQIEEIDNEDVITFNNEHILKNNYSESYQNQVTSAIKLFFMAIEGRQIKIDELERPRRSRTLPEVLSKEEVKRLLSGILNIKHKRCSVLFIHAACVRESYSGWSPSISTTTEALSASGNRRAVKTELCQWE